MAFTLFKPSFTDTSRRRCSMVNSRGSPSQCVGGRGCGWRAVSTSSDIFDCRNSEWSFNGKQCRSRDDLPSSRPYTATVGSWGDPHNLMKETAHVGMARKSAIESDVNERDRRIFQQFPSSFQLQIEQVIVWTVSSGRLEHPYEMDAAVAAFVCESLQAQITIEIPHALDYPSQHVSRQSGCASVVGLRLSVSAQVERPQDEGLRKMFRV